MHKGEWMCYHVDWPGDTSFQRIRFRQVYNKHKFYIGEDPGAAAARP